MEGKLWEAVPSSTVLRCGNVVEKSEPHTDYDQAGCLAGRLPWRNDT